VGLATGAYVLGASGVSPTAGTFFGVGPQLGLDIGGFRAGLSYNALVGAGPVSRDFLSLDLAFRLGGGRKED
jgi:hypothetical protein